MSSRFTFSPLSIDNYLHGNASLSSNSSGGSSTRSIHSNTSVTLPSGDVFVNSPTMDPRGGKPGYSRESSLRMNLTSDKTKFESPDGQSTRVCQETFTSPTRVQHFETFTSPTRVQHLETFTSPTRVHLVQHLESNSKSNHRNPLFDSTLDDFGNNGGFHDLDLGFESIRNSSISSSSGGGNSGLGRQDGASISRTMNPLAFSAFPHAVKVETARNVDSRRTTEMISISQGPNPGSSQRLHRFQFNQPGGVSSIQRRITTTTSTPRSSGMFRYIRERAMG